MIHLNNKIFIALLNSDNGEVDESTRFYYYQDKDVIWADYSGIEIIKGHLIGKQLADGTLDFRYHHINKSGEIKIGKCVSEIIELEDGRLKLYEKWQWLCDDMSEGKSELIEVKKEI